MLDMLKTKGLKKNERLRNEVIQNRREESKFNKLRDEEHVSGR